MAGLRVAFMGSPDLGVPCLEALQAADDIEVAAVVTLGDRRRGRRGKAVPTPIGQAALDLDLPLQRWEKNCRREIESTLSALDLDAIIVIAFARILKPSLLDLPRLGCLNLHASLLPWGRGASPIQQAVLDGLAITGWAAMRMEAGLDTGPVLDTLQVRIEPRWNAGDLYAELKVRAPEFLLASLRGWADGSLEPERQDDHLATYAGLIPRDAGALDWSETVEQLDRRIRAYTPAPGCWFNHEGVRVRVLEAEPASTGSGRPGEVLSCRPDFTVACGHGALILKQVVPAGRKPMSVTGWLNGTTITPGEHLEQG
ncbi:MAG: methionyl-tRNA formyltransferase [bacterium]|nr:methionyl-tRNA formyltransferase [bacterium]